MSPKLAPSKCCLFFPGRRTSTQSQHPHQRVQLSHPKRQQVLRRQVRLRGLQRGRDGIQRPRLSRRKM